MEFELSGTPSVRAGGSIANAFGLHDMLGNIREWTCSEYKKRYDGSEQKCAVYASGYSLRGGSWYGGPGWVRAANRYSSSPGNRSDLNPDDRGRCSAGGFTSQTRWISHTQVELCGPRRLAWTAGTPRLPAAGFLPGFNGVSIRDSEYSESLSCNRLDQGIW